MEKEKIIIKCPSKNNFKYGYGFEVCFIMVQMATHFDNLAEDNGFLKSSYICEEINNYMGAFACIDAREDRDVFSAVFKEDKEIMEIKVEFSSDNEFEILAFAAAIQDYANNLTPNDDERVMLDVSKVKNRSLINSFKNEFFPRCFSLVLPNEKTSLDVKARIQMIHANNI